MAPKPLKNLATGYASDYQSLTPRTPRSQAGRAEEARGPLVLHPMDDDDGGDGEYTTYTQQQSEPLLASSASATFPPTGYRNRGDEHTGEINEKAERGSSKYKWVLQRLPLVAGSLAAAFLLFLVILSVKRPEALRKVVGDTNATHEGVTSPQDNLLATSPSASTILSAPSPLPTHSLDPNVISYENYTQFPLQSLQYLYECDKINHGFMHHMAYWDLPQGGIKDVPHHDAVENFQLPEGEPSAVCRSTITYMLDGTVGLLADLALMAQVAAIARERNRTFLVDDTYWNRGKWSDHFQNVRERQPGPEPGCRAPPPEELVACPRQARHWVVTSRTAKYHLGAGFSDNYEDAYGHSLNRLKPIYERSVESLAETIRPNAQNAALIRSARTNLLSSLRHTHEEETRNPDEYIGVHIRRGDKRGLSWEFHTSFVPIKNFVDAVNVTWQRLHPSLSASNPIVYVASDSPVAAAEFIDALPAETEVFSLSRSTVPDLKVLASKSEYVQSEFNDLDVEDRVRATRGMVVDFAMLSGAWVWAGEVEPIATVCTLGSAVCKLSAVSLGWERAFGYRDASESPMGNLIDATKRWVEIDNRGAIDPIWRAYDLFF